MLVAIGRRSAPVENVTNTLSSCVVCRAGLALGSAEHWKETLRVMTGDTEMSGQAMLEYFKPLLDFLREANGADGASGQSVAATPALLLALLTPLALLRLAA